jgi:hypothetical protein
MSKIELRLSDVNPPAPEPKRTIYRDIVNLPDPVKLGLTVHYFNYDDVGLYFQITGSGTGYTFGTVNLGLLASGSEAYINLDQFASRAKPTVAQLPNGEMSENITLTLKAYTDSGYTTLKWTFERVVTVHWINSADAAFTVDFLNNFDDGTVQGWAAVLTYGGSGATATAAKATDYVLSVPYSLKMEAYSGGYSEVMAYLWKSFTTPNKEVVYAIIDLRITGGTNSYVRSIQIQREDGSILVQIGIWASALADAMPRNKWLRIVVPLPKSTTLETRIHGRWRSSDTGRMGYVWLDDFKIISK